MAAPHYTVQDYLGLGEMEFLQIVYKNTQIEEFSLTVAITLNSCNNLFNLIPSRNNLISTTKNSNERNSHKEKNCWSFVDSLPLFISIMLDPTQSAYGVRTVEPHYVRF